MALLVSTQLAAIAALAQEPDGVDGGLARRGRIGLVFSEADDGLLVRAIGRNTPAAAVGLRPGDIITGIEGWEATSRDSLMDRVRMLRAGESMMLQVRRGDQQVEVTLQADELPREGDLDAFVEYTAFKGSGGLLRSLWAFPKKGTSAPKPGVLIIRGVGAPPADAPGLSPFRELAFQFAYAGFVAVRYDGEGIGDSEGLSNATVDFAHEVADAQAALQHMRSDPRIDPQRIVIVGQGTGGGVAAVVASRDERVAGLVVIGTVARPLIEYLADSRRQQLGLAGVGPGEADDIIRKHIEVFGRLLVGGTVRQDPSGLVDADGTVFGKVPGYWRQYDQVNFGRLFSELKVPVLNVFGEYDIVSTLGEHRAIAEALRAGSHRGQLLVVLDRTDHELRQFESKQAAWDGFNRTEAEVNQRALGQIVDWARQRVRADQP
jgi:hypothetical protein